MANPLVETGYAERSSSKKVMDRVVSVVYPRSIFERYMHYSIWMRGLDNVVDEGTSYSDAYRQLEKHGRLIRSDGKSSQATAGLERNLKQVLNAGLPKTARQENKFHLLQLLQYFETDLFHRKSLSGFSKNDLSVHIEGGYPACLGSIINLLTDRQVKNEGFKQLARVHGQAEPLGDISEDLTRGFILHCREDGADWIDDLVPGKKVPAEKIDNYVVNRRGQLAQRMFRLAPWAAVELPNLVGSLMSLEYVRRSIRLNRKRYLPQTEVIFAAQRMN